MTPTDPAPDRSPRRRRAAEYRQRDLAVLRHVSRYGVALNAVVSACLFGGKEAGHVLRRFADRNWLTLHAGDIPGGMSYGTLTPLGGKEIGLELKPKQRGAVALDLAIAVAYYCICVKLAARRYRLQPSEVQQLKLGLPHSVPYVLTEEHDSPAVLRVLPATSGKPALVWKKLDQLLEQGLADRRQAPWLRSKQLGVVVLGHSRERVSQLQASLSKQSRFQEFRIAVGLGPTAATLARCLRAQKRSTS